MTSGLTTTAAPSVKDLNSLPWLSHVRVRLLDSSPTLDVAHRVLEQLGADVSTDTAVDAADIVLADRIRGRGYSANRTAAQYLADVATKNRSVWVTASAYGLESSRADVPASELTLLAAGGILGHSRIGAQWAPTVTPGKLASKLIGYVVAVSALHALHSFQADGKPVHVDVAGQGAVVATGLALEMAHALGESPEEGGSARYGAPSGFYDCLDGAVYVLALEDHQWRAFATALAPLMDSVPTLEDARDHSDYVNTRLAEWTSSRTIEECEGILQRAGVPCTAVNTVASFVERAQRQGRSIELRGENPYLLPAEVTQVPSESVAKSKTLSDLKILDAGHVLAVPLAAAWLGAMGAQVSKLEDPDRLDIYRRRGPFYPGTPGLNRSSYFNQLNFCKTTLDVRFNNADAELDTKRFDVVLHNLTPRRARVVGVDSASVLATGHPLLGISSSGFGGTGEWSGYRAYGHNIHAFAGLVAATRDARDEMGDMGTPWADPLTSAAVAAWVLAWSLAAEHHSTTAVDISMAELTAAQLTDIIDEDLADVYRNVETLDFFVEVSQSQQLLAVTLNDATDIATFEGLTGRTLPEIPRRGQLIELVKDDLPADFVDSLIDAGVAVSPVYTAHDLARDEFLRSTGLFQHVTSTDLGRYRITGLPWTFVGQDRHAVTAAPERF
ncbi:CoA transferase [Rhodococcus sp. NPDC056743]|uniref:CoA transferase n=1 Tax=Rhodococcus sp. NPDC056743 TaxID=3345934 RepID=UPI0036718EF3